MDAAEHNVFLKLQAYDEADGLYINTIPLKAESVDFTTDKTIPSFPIPIGAITGESTTIALDLGMSNKSVSLKGVITNQTIIKKFSGLPNKEVTFTAHEIAQMIASGVDSTGLAQHQAFNELVILMPSTVDKDYIQVAERLIPFTWRSRGDSNRLDNSRVPMPFDFPDATTADGIKGFVSFSMDFQVATIIP
mgnify:CR=1 FL=1